jgi:hypothetical protein
MRTLILATMLLAGALMPAAAQTVAGVDLAARSRDSRPAAERAIQTLGEMVAPANAARLGFADAASVGRAELGVPFADFAVDLPSLAVFRAGSDPVRLLRPTQMAVWPLLTPGDRHSSVTLAFRGGRWQAVSLGSPNRTRALVATRAEILRRDEARLPHYFQVRVPAWNLLFVGRVGPGGLQLTPAVDAPEFGLLRGRTEDAATLFARLADPAARDPGGLR